MTFKKFMIKPFLKWPGGKRQLVSTLTSLLPSDILSYTWIEPFIGGGAMLFHIKPVSSIIADFNSDLVNAYLTVKWDSDELISILKTFSNDESFFYKIRNEFNISESNRVLKSAQLIYLNKTCFNGLYRINSKGHFNSPFGKYVNPTICDISTIQDDSNFLVHNAVDIYHQSFEKTMALADSSSFVYLDPPYHPINDEKANFTAYTKEGFSREDQIHLKEECDKLSAKGIKFMQSNSNSSFIKELYKDYKVVMIDSVHGINVDPSKRKVKEVVIMNY